MVLPAAGIDAFVPPAPPADPAEPTDVEEEYVLAPEPDHFVDAPPAAPPAVPPAAAPVFQYPTDEVHNNDEENPLDDVILHLREKVVRLEAGVRVAPDEDDEALLRMTEDVGRLTAETLPLENTGEAEAESVREQMKRFKVFKKHNFRQLLGLIGKPFY